MYKLLRNIQLKRIGDLKAGTEEVNPADGGNGPLMTQPIGRRTEHGELESSPKRNSIGPTAG